MPISLPRVCAYYTKSFDPLPLPLRFISQEMVDNNPVPNRLAGPKILIPNPFTQPTSWLHDLCLEFITVHDNDLCLLLAMAFSLLILLMSHIWYSSSRYNFYVFDAMTSFGPKIDDLPTRSRFASCYAYPKIYY